jgi:hypothetical protein
MALRLWMVGLGVTAVVVGVLMVRVALTASQAVQATMAGF